MLRRAAVLKRICDRRRAQNAAEDTGECEKYQKYIKISCSMSTGYGDCCPCRRGHGAKEKTEGKLKRRYEDKF